MRLLRTIVATVAIVMAFAQGATAKNEQEQIYVFGFAASFNDSIVYFTEMQLMDSVWMDTKNKFLLGRDNYSYQLRDYLRDSLDMPYRTCIVMFAEEKKDIDKKYAKMKKLYTVDSNGSYEVRYLSLNDFAFTALDMSYLIEDEKAAKEARKRARQQQKEQQQNMPQGGPGGGGGMGGGPGGGMGGGF